MIDDQPLIIRQVSPYPPTEADLIARRVASYRKWARRRARLRLRRVVWQGAAKALKRLYFQGDGRILRGGGLT